MNTHVRDNLLETGPAKVTGNSQLLVSTAANAIAARSVGSAYVGTAQTTTSTTYTNLTTSGPAVTVTTGTLATVFLSALCFNGSAETCFMDFEITGATARAAADSSAFINESASVNNQMQATMMTQVATTPGSNTFTAKYRVNAGTGTWQDRRLSVLPF